MSSTNNIFLPVGWPEILAKVEQALAEVEQEASRSAEALERDLAPARVSEASAQLQRSGESEPDGTSAPRTAVLSHEPDVPWASCVVQADQTVAETEALLQASETALRQWLTLADAIRRKLAN